MPFLVMGFISLVDEIQFMLISTSTLRVKHITAEACAGDYESEYILKELYTCIAGVPTKVGQRGRG